MYSPTGTTPMYLETSGKYQDVSPNDNVYSFTS